MDEHDLTKHIWIQKIKRLKEHNMNQNKSAIQTQKPKRKTATQRCMESYHNLHKNCSRSIEQSAPVGSSK